MSRNHHARISAADLQRFRAGLDKRAKTFDGVVALDDPRIDSFLFVGGYVVGILLKDGTQIPWGIGAQSE